MTIPELKSILLRTSPPAMESDFISEWHSRGFKPNCGLVIVDFMVRHGLMETELMESQTEDGDEGQSNPKESLERRMRRDLTGIISLPVE